MDPLRKTSLLRQRLHYDIVALKQAVPGLRVADSLEQRPYWPLRQTVIALWQATRDATRGTSKLSQAVFQGDLLAVTKDDKNGTALENFHFQFGLRDHGGRDIKLDEPEVPDIFGPEALPLFEDDIRDVLAETKCTLKFLGPNEAGTMVRFIITINPAEAKAAEGRCDSEPDWHD